VSLLTPTNYPGFNSDD